MAIIWPHLIYDGTILENDLKAVFRLPITFALERDIYAIITIGPAANDGLCAKLNELPYLRGRADRWKIIFCFNACFDV
ncbi:hypothetical protein ORS3428_12700 [Mesorhizobium sp. ORS 3428]|nr:hypothetical protein ORS3428_12700 [Mesorhizobium sp. ORS 3428]